MSFLCFDRSGSILVDFDLLHSSPLPANYADTLEREAEGINIWIEYNSPGRRKAALKVLFYKQNIAFAVEYSE